VNDSTNHIIMRPVVFWCLVAVCALCIVHSIVAQLNDPLELNWDPAMYLHFAQMLLRGGIPYVDFVDINPPMIMYLSTIPAALAHLADLHVIVVFKLLLGVLSLVSMAMVIFILRRSILLDKNWPYLALVLLVIANIGMCVGREYGQREHIFLLTYLPFFFLRWRRWEGDRTSTAFAVFIGCLASAGFCLKPYFLLMPLISELWWLVKYKDWKCLLAPEIVTSASCVLAYCFHFFLVPETMRHAFLQQIAEYPLLQRFWNSAIWDVVILRGRYWPEIYLALIYSLIVAFWFRKKHAVIVPLIFFTLSAYAVAVVQMRWWDYYKIPMWVGILMLGTVLVADLICLTTSSGKRSWLIELRSRLVYGLLVIVLAAMAIVDVPKAGAAVQALRLEEPRQGREPSANLREAFERKALRSTTLAALMKYARPGDVGVVLAGLDLPVYPSFLQYGMQSGCRYAYTFPLMINHFEETRARKVNKFALAERYRRRVEEEYDLILTDVRKRRPILIIIQQDEQFLKDNTGFGDCLTDPKFGPLLLEGFRCVEAYTDFPDITAMNFRVYVRQHDGR
jgi:hypothetical protein